MTDIFPKSLKLPGHPALPISQIAILYTGGLGQQENQTPPRIHIYSYPAFKGRPPVCLLQETRVDFPHPQTQPLPPGPDWPAQHSSGPDSCASALPSPGGQAHQAQGCVAMPCTRRGLSRARGMDTSSVLWLYEPKSLPSTWDGGTSNQRTRSPATTEEAGPRGQQMEIAHGVPVYQPREIEAQGTGRDCP